MRKLRTIPRYAAGLILAVIASAGPAFSQASLMQRFSYLHRNPNDPPELTLDFQGYNFWLTKLNQFNGDYSGAEMVKAFITSGEYRQRFGP